MQTARLESDTARKTGRTRVLMRAMVICEAGTFQVGMRDLSNSGARIYPDARLPEETDVIFIRGDLCAAGKVAWSNRTGAGIEFYRQLSQSDVASALNVAGDA